MSQHGRHDYPKAIHLVSVRGQPNQSIFFPLTMLRDYPGSWEEHSRDLRFWERLVERACDRHEARVHAYSWLPNEALLLLQRFAVPLDVLIASTLGQYSRYLHEVGRVPKDASPYPSRYESVEVTPGVLPYGVRHLYWRAVRAGLSASPIAYPLSSYALHYAKVSPQWFEQKDFIAGLEQRGYFGREGGDRFLLKPEIQRYKALFSLRSGRKPRIVGEPVDVQDALWESEHQGPIPSIEDIIAGVNRLIRTQSGVAPESVLGKSLVTWYATRSGAARLEEVGRWFGRSPTTLRRDVESHRRRRPTLFAYSIEELLTARSLIQDELTSLATPNRPAVRKPGALAAVSCQEPAPHTSYTASRKRSLRVQRGANAARAGCRDIPLAASDKPGACKETCDR